MVLIARAAVRNRIPHTRYLSTERSEQSWAFPWNLFRRSSCLELWSLSECCYGLGDVLGAAIFRLYFGFVFCECTRPTACNRQTCFLFLSTGTGRRYEYLQFLSMFTLVHNIDAVYVCLDIIIYLDMHFISSRLSSGWFQ